LTDGVTFKLEGLEDTVANLEALASQPTRRNVVRRTLLAAGEPTADLAARLAPHERGVLSFSIVVSTTLTRRHRRDKVNEVEVYIGPSGGQGALFYASHREFGTVLLPASPYMRPAWESTKGQVLGLIISGLKAEIEKAAARASRKAARLARAA
jgi:HK97 gp10 family phage protein